MADKLYFSRDTKVYVAPLDASGNEQAVFEIPVLDGFSFSQATNSSEITLNEMSDSSGNSRRGRQMFNNSLAPAEWSFSTYARPFKSSGSGNANGTAGYHHACEEVLWAMMVGDAAYDDGADTEGGLTFTGGSGAAPSTVTLTGTAVTLTTPNTAAGAQSNKRTITFQSVTSSTKVGMIATIGSDSVHVTSVDTTANTVTFSDPVTIGQNTAANLNTRMATDATVTVNTSSSGGGGGAQLSLVYTQSNGQYTASTIAQAGVGYENGDTISVSGEEIARAFGAEFNRTFADDYFADLSGTAGTPSQTTTGTAFPNGLTRTTNATNGLKIDFNSSNKTTLGTANIYFALGKANTGTDDSIYKLSKCCVNEVSIDFDIDGIATLAWSGMGTIISDEETTMPSGTIINEGTDSTSNFIRNRLTSMTAVSSLGGSAVTYDLTLTGGNITITNNMTFLTPETLGVVNQPLGHVTGTRNIAGSFTCYLNRDTNSSAELFEKLITNNTTVTNSFALQFNIGGSTGTPRIEFDLDQCHLEVPAHSIEDVISVEASFHALPSSVEGTDEVEIRYIGS